MGWGKYGFNCWGVRSFVLVLFLFYVDVSGMRPLSVLSSKPLTIPTPWVLLHIRWSIPLGDYLPFPFGESGDWAKAHHFLFTPTFPCFLIFPLLLIPQRYSTFDCCLLGLLLNINNIFIYFAYVLYSLQFPTIWLCGLVCVVKGYWVPVEHLTWLTFCDDIEYWVLPSLI